MEFPLEEGWKVEVQVIGNQLQSYQENACIIISGGNDRGRCKVAKREASTLQKEAAHGVNVFFKLSYELPMRKKKSASQEESSFVLEDA
ncbi:hypothetical protein D5086_006782 [Populus alba]|uniref:Uncharacterized protein n=1 Tax=Populus alba TaxID=43335 RepID=A0ACC4CLM1_POPAL